MPTHTASKICICNFAAELLKEEPTATKSILMRLVTTCLRNPGTIQEVYTKFPYPITTRIDKAMQMPKLSSRTLPKLACWYHTSLHPSSWCYTSWDLGNGMFIELIKFPYLSRFLIIASYFIQCFTFTSCYFNIPLQKTLLMFASCVQFSIMWPLNSSSSGHCSMNFFSDQQRPIQEETKTSEGCLTWATHPASPKGQGLISTGKTSKLGWKPVVHGVAWSRYLRIPN